MTVACSENDSQSKETCRSLSQWRAIKIVLTTFILVTCFKAILIPTYHSTDFEVHRNWLAITHTLPIKEWYVNAHSQWTLDYPPFFAWFEFLLGRVAIFFDREMLRVENLNYASPSTVIFQRASVMVTDLLFAYGVKEVGNVFCPSPESFLTFALLSLCNVGLLVVDHVHFQYNGFLFGMLLLSVANVSRTSQVSVLQGAAWFAVLLNFKHIYVYVAPAFVVWLLRTYCVGSGRFLRRFATLGGLVAVVLTLSFGPFASQIPQVLSRLFPFKRGLVHAYWAANAWALYVGVDKVLSMVWKQLGWLTVARSAVMTGGLVQEQSFAVLPTPTPIVTLLLTLLATAPALWCLFAKKCADPKQFVRCVVLCGLTSFMFGWHVHEKAILTAIIPLCVLAVANRDDARVFLILSSAGHTALLPLLHPSDLAPLKLLLLVTYTVAGFLALTRKFGHRLLYFHEYAYVAVLPLVTMYETTVHKLAFGDELPFLPLALTSLYCAIGVSYCWLVYYKMFVNSCSDGDRRRKRE